ncbi:MAG: CotH kinase family protein [Pseudomonadota bacterium]|nr:CotH kinase family protein [Pseudomonadota bacterium]
MRLLLPLLVACSGSGLTRARQDPADSAVPEDTAAPADTAAPPDTDVEIIEPAEDPPEPVVTEEAGGEQDTSDLAGWLFGLHMIHQVEITLPDTSEAALAATPYVWAPADISIDGEELAQVGVRLRGKIGSFRTLAGKPKFKISFGEYVEDQRFYGLEELSLNNSVVDCSAMKEVMGYYVYGLAGVPTLRASYAQVSVNGAPYGLYVLVETPSDKWLDRNFEDPSGNLYDGKYVWYGGYSYTLLDFAAGVDDSFQLEEGTDVGNADIAAVSAALTESAGRPFFYGAMGSVLDWDAYHRMTAVDQFIGHNDGYSMNTNNFRVYFDPTDGKAELLPWDLDYTFLYDYEWGLSWSNANGNITNACFADEGCFARHRTTMSTFLDTWDADDAWKARFDQIEALTYAATQADPRSECAASSVQPYRDYVRAWLGSNSTALRGWYTL